MNRVNVELLYVFGVPLLFALGAVWAQRTGGARRLWIAAGIVIPFLTVPLLFTRTISLYNTGPLSAAAVETWTLPISALAAAVATQLFGHHKIPRVVRAAVAWGGAYLATAAGFWVA